MPTSLLRNHCIALEYETLLYEVVYKRTWYSGRGWEFYLQDESGGEGAKINDFFGNNFEQIFFYKEIREVVCGLESGYILVYIDVFWVFCS